MLGNLERVNESLIKESTGTPSYGIYKYDVESDMEFSKDLGIRSVPTIKIFKNGNEVFSQAGVMTPNQVLGLLK
jgi:thioredoxin-like negative regulator of GroEL